MASMTYDGKPVKKTQNQGRVGEVGLATVVGVLIEVPVMLLVVKVVNASKPWYEAGQRA